MSRKRASYRLFGEGFSLNEADMDWYRDRYPPDQAAVGDSRASPLIAEDVAGLPPTRLRHVRRPGLARTHERQEEGAFEARGAMLETAGALRMGLARPRG